MHSRSRRADQSPPAMEQVAQTRSEWVALPPQKSYDDAGDRVAGEDLNMQVVVVVVTRHWGRDETVLADESDANEAIHTPEVAKARPWAVSHHTWPAVVRIRQAC